MVSLLPDSEIQENKTALGLDLSRYQPLEQTIKIIAQVTTYTNITPSQKLYKQSKTKKQRKGIISKRMSMLLPVVMVFLAGAYSKQKTQIYIPSQISSYKMGLLLKGCNVIFKEHMGGRLSRHSRRPRQSTRRPLGHTPFISCFSLFFFSILIV